ncbi:MAG TPA: hypothetical protein EYH26_04320 [Pyrodictium sp.]|nr:hypothetical protein [Pyrodictium sp.]HIQ55207.1 hypothetical protein [Pyrodictium sp.]
MKNLTVPDRGATCRSAELLVREKPKYRLYELLGEKSWYRVSSSRWLEKKRMKLDPFQELAVRILVWRGGIVEASRMGSVAYSEEYRGARYEFIFGRGNTKADAMYVEDSVSWFWELYSKLPNKPTPIFVIDMGWFPRHRLEKEVESLRRQIAYTLNLIRYYLWDKHLLLTNVRPGMLEWLCLMLGRAAIDYSHLSTRDALEVRGYGKIIALDPSADQPLSRDDVFDAEAFIVGGVVDILPVRGATKMLVEKLGDVERRKIVFHGDVFGVPNRINAVIEIILRARYITCGDIDSAIRAVMSSRDARLRAYVEISRLLRGTPPSERVVNADFYCELRRWLPISPKDFIIAAKMAQAKVVDNLEACECISKDQSDHRRCSAIAGSSPCRS